MNDTIVAINFIVFIEIDFIIRIYLFIIIEYNLVVIIAITIIITITIAQGPTRLDFTTFNFSENNNFFY